MHQAPIKYGITAGLVTAAILTGLYFVETKLFLNYVLVFCISMAVPFIMMVKAARKVKEEQGDSLDKRTAIRTAFIVWILAMLIFQVFMYLIFQYDEQLTVQLKDLVREARGEEMAEEIGAPSIAASFQQFVIMLLPGFLFSYMVASFLKNKR